MSDRKTISISPDLFTFKGGNNTTRKKKSSNEHKDLKIKNAPKQTHPKTLKNRLLHYIRKNQEQNFKKMHGGNSEIPVPNKSNISHITDTFNTDFEESMKYMNTIADEVSQKVDNDYMINRTLRNYKSMNPESILSGEGGFHQAISGLSSTDPVFMGIPETPNNIPIKLAANAPQWGCMKGGSLPTYKTWLNQTQKNRNSSGSHHDFFTGSSHYNNPPKISLNDMSISSISSIGNGGNGSNDRANIPGREVVGGYREPTKVPIPKLGARVGIGSFSGETTDEFRMEKELEPAKISQIRQTMDKIKLDTDIQTNKLKYGKRKKTVRRTYNLGKSHTMPKVSVLISNKTVRKNISTKTEKLKHTPIEEIRTVLIKKGFIKVGSLATNDVLRKMYESMVLVCGEVENHNPDNLLYNYFNS